MTSNFCDFFHIYFYLQQIQEYSQTYPQNMVFHAVISCSLPVQPQLFFPENVNWLA